MKKAIISVLLSLSLTLTFFLFPFCKPTKGSNPPKETINPIAAFPLTMTPSEMLGKAEDLGFQLVIPNQDIDWTEQYGIQNPIYDGRSYNVTGSFWYQYEEINFFFGTDGKMKSISTESDLFATPEGIRVGDSMFKMLRTYGIFSVTKGLAMKTKDGYYIFSTEMKKGKIVIAFWAFSEKPFEHEN